MLSFCIFMYHEANSKQQKCITNYRIYKELNLNAGNVNSFLKYGNTDKLSVETVRKVLTFINEY